MKKRFAKKGYFFLLDAIIALTIISIGLFLLFSSDNVSAPQTEQTALYANDIIDFMSETEIQEFNHPVAGLGGTMWQSGTITKAENTLLQQAAYFYAVQNISTVATFIEAVTLDIIPQRYEYEIWIDSELVYPYPASGTHNDSKNQSAAMLSSKTIAHGFLDENLGNLYGPYLVEVFIWD